MLVLGKGEVVETLPYSIVEEEQLLRKHEVVVDGVVYSGWCRKCNHLVPKDKAITQINVDGIGNLILDVFCNNKSCFY